MTRHDGSGAPQSHTGGVIGRTAVQHAAQTGPADGASRGRSHAAQRGATSTATSASAIASRTARAAASLRGASARRGRLLGIGDLDPFGVAPESFEGVEVTGVWREDVHDEIKEVHEDP